MSKSTEKLKIVMEGLVDLPWGKIKTFTLVWKEVSVGTEGYLITVPELKIEMIEEQL